mgnify:CR=1 FL=1
MKFNYNTFDNLKYNRLAIKNNKFYKVAKPCSHIRFKNFLNKTLAYELFKNFPKYEEDCWINHKKFGKNINTVKKTQHDERYFPDKLRNFLRSLNSKQFLLFLETLTGINGLIPDPYFIGGGLHIAKEHGYLNTHVDFNWHHKLQLHRRVNVLIYLTPDYGKINGGQFELRNSNNKKIIKKYEPIFNSCLIFSTSSKSFHGHPNPVKGKIYRRVINAYYYTVNRPKSEIYNPTFTNYTTVKKSKIDLKKFKISNSPFAKQLLDNYKKLK